MFNYNILDYQGRLDLVNKLLNDNINIDLEQAANYLLNAKDIQIKKELEYRIFSDREMFRKRMKESGNGLLTNDDEIDILVEKKNKNIEKKQKIVEKDKTKPILKDYQEFINYLTQTKHDKDYKYRRNLELMCRELRLDQLDAKNQLEHTIYFKHVGDNSTEIDWFLADYSNKEHLMAILKLRSDDLAEWLACLALDVNKLLEDVPLTKRQLEVLNLWRNCHTQEEISEILTMAQSTVNEHLESIADKVKHKYDEHYNDWHYTFEEKGEYKKCSMCKKVKLVSEFGKHPKTKDKLQSTCKQCNLLLKSE